MNSFSHSLPVAEGLNKSRTRGPWWSSQRKTVTVLKDASLQIRSGSTLALVGESGAGKTTLALCLAGLERPDSGQIWFEGQLLSSLSKKQLTEVRRSIQILFQDSSESLSSRLTASELIEEPLCIRNRESKKERLKTALELLDLVELPASHAKRRPSEMSGGERQRIAIARAIALDAKLLILDEPFIGLDLSTRSQIVNLLVRLQRERSLTYLYISHDLALVRYLADEVAVMDQGRIVEQGGTRAFFSYAPVVLGLSAYSARHQTVGNVLKIHRVGAR